MGYTGDKKRAYQLAWVSRRRDEWIAEHGPCQMCGSNEVLEVDHVDPASKTYAPAKVWGLSQAKRDAELAKCQVLCHDCHEQKSKAEHAKGSQHGHAKLNEAIVLDMRQRFVAGESGASLAREYGVNPRTAQVAISGKKWKHI